MDHKQYNVELDEKLPHPLPKQKKGQGTKSKSLDFNHFDITKTTFHENSRGLRLQTTDKQPDNHLAHVQSLRHNL